MREDVRTLMLRYAERGVDDWKNASGEVQDLAERALGLRIATGVGEARAAVARKAPAFIPMPRGQERGGTVKWFFFLPLGSPEAPKWILFLLIADRTDGGEGSGSMAFRFECPAAEGREHGYYHVQMTRRIIGGPVGRHVLPAVGEGVPEEYPAFPVPACDASDLFLAMLTAVHGFPKGMELVLQEVLQSANVSTAAHRHMDRLREMLRRPG